MNKTINVIRKSNGDTAFRIPVVGFENVDMVTLQKDGEIRWASIGPLTVEGAYLFSDAVRLALSFTRDLLTDKQLQEMPHFGSISSGVTYAVTTVYVK